MLDPAFQSVLDDARAGMQKSVDHLADELGTIRAGRASAAMLDGVRVEAYGSQLPINQVATVQAPSADLLVVTPFDKSQLGAVERGISQANLGVNPTNDGQVIRISIPPLTEERRKDLAKAAKTKAEEAKVAIRNVRKSAKADIGKAYDAERLPDDMRFDAENELQKLTDGMTGRADGLLAKKEKDIMTV